MPELDRWVIRAVFDMIARGGPGAGRVPGAVYCINLSGASLGDPGLLDFVRDELARVRVPPPAICFEITETAAVTNLPEAGVLTRSLKALGFKLALDDFGAGLSSFAYLKSLAVDYLKIEGRFVRDMASNRESRAIVEAINGVGHALGCAPSPNAWKAARRSPTCARSGSISARGTGSRGRGRSTRERGAHPTAGPAEGQGCPATAVSMPSEPLSIPSTAKDIGSSSTWSAAT